MLHVAPIPLWWRSASPTRAVWARNRGVSYFSGVGRDRYIDSGRAEYTLSRMRRPPASRTVSGMATEWLRPWLRGVAAWLPWWARDALIAGFVGTLVAAGIATTTQPPEDHVAADAVAYALGVGAAVPLLVRRRWPAVVLLVVAALHVAYHMRGYPDGPPYLAFVVALFTVAHMGRLRLAVAVGAVVGGGSVLQRWLGEGEPLFGLLMVVDVAFLTVTVLLGDTLHSRRAWAAEVRDREAQAAVERERAARRRMEEERLRIARELHDVLAHTVAVISVHAGVATDTFDDEPEVARGALGTIRSASQEAIDEVEATVSLLRGSEGTPRTPTPGLAQLDELIEKARGSGLRVPFSIERPAVPVSRSVELTAYRVVQESLTNVVRHAGATTASVTVTVADEALSVAVTDDGCGDNGWKAGHGINGMRERVSALGGWFEATSEPGGFTVRVWLPLHPARI